MLIKQCIHAERRAAGVQLVDEFVRAIFGRFPHTVLQFEVRPRVHCWLQMYKFASM